MNHLQLPWKCSLFCLLVGNCIDIQAQNLLINGSFEEGPTPPDGFFMQLDPGSTAIKSWIVTRGQIDYKHKRWGDPSDGSFSIDLDGSPGPGGIMQRFQTMIGQEYMVNFDMAGNPEAGPLLRSLKVSAAGQSNVYVFDTTGHSTRNMGWLRKSWSFIAAERETGIEFFSLDTTTLYHGPMLDNVSIERVGALFSRGEVNQDGNRDIADPIAILGYLFSGDILRCLDAADVNNDSQVDISDPIGLLGYLFLGTLPPPSPFPGCGFDTDEDNLDCELEDCE